MFESEIYWKIIDMHRGLTSWERLAEEIGISKTTILRQRKCNLPLNMENTSSIARVLSIPLHTLCQLEVSSVRLALPLPEGLTYNSCWWSVVDCIRSDKRLSWSSVGKLMDVSDRTLVAAKNRKSSLPLEMAIRLTEVLEIDIDELDAICHECCGVKPQTLSLEEKFSRLDERGQSLVLNLIDALLKENK